jgi:hypothetical protein
VKEKRRLWPYIKPDVLPFLIIVVMLSGIYMYYLLEIRIVSPEDPLPDHTIPIMDVAVPVMLVLLTLLILYRLLGGALSERRKDRNRDAMLEPGGSYINLLTMEITRAKEMLDSTPNPTEKDLDTLADNLTRICRFFKNGILPEKE